MKSPHHYDQDVCSRCCEKCNPKELVSVVCRIPKSTHIILICPKCVASFITWLMHSTEKTSKKKPFRNSLSEDTKEDMR